MRDNKRKVQQLGELVKTSQWQAKKKQAYQDYLAYLDANDKAPRTQNLYALHIHRLGAFRPEKNFQDYAEKDMLEFKGWLKEKGYAEYNIHNQMIDCQTFFRWLLKLEKGERPQNMKWYQVDKSKIIKKLNPQEILSPEDIKSLVSSTSSLRNKAMIFVLWESGCRISELLNVHTGDINFSEKVVSFFVNKSKTKGGEREIFLIQSVPTLMDWLAVHEFKSKKDSFLFYSVTMRNKGTGLEATNVHCILKRAAERCGITKPVNPHALRKSRATYIAKRRHSSEVMKRMFGWSDSSAMPSVYARIAGEDVKQALLEDNGLAPKIENGNELAPLKCPFCGTVNPADAVICKNTVCLRPITIEGIQEEKKNKETLLLEMMEGKFSELEKRLDKKIDRFQVSRGGKKV